MAFQKAWFDVDVESESPLALRPAEDPLYSRTRKTSKNEQQQEEEEEEEVEVTSLIKRQRRISMGVLDALVCRAKWHPARPARWWRCGTRRLLMGLGLTLLL